MSDPFDDLLVEALKRWPITWLDPPTADELREAIAEAEQYPPPVPWPGDGDQGGGER